MAMHTCSRGHTFEGEEPCPVCWPGYRTFTVQSHVLRYAGEAAWYFATVPKKTADIMKERFATGVRGWGSLPVTVTIGATRWKTSVFPDKKAGTYLLPVKADVRKKEGIEAGDAVTLTIEVRL